MKEIDVAGLVEEAAKMSVGETTKWYLNRDFRPGELGTMEEQVNNLRATRGIPGGVELMRVGRIVYASCKQEITR